MSKIEVDAITQQSGTTLTVGGGASKTVVADATTVTLGRCGGTVALASGASQTGFGRTGTVNWDTTPKTATFTGVSGNGYFVNTTAGVVTVNLPASPSAGDIVAIADYASTANTNNITIGRNGSNINGAASDLTITRKNSAITLVYADASKGWKNTDSSNIDDISIVPAFVTASVSGACNQIITDNDHKLAIFKGPGTFTVSCAGNDTGSNTVEYMVVAGGGGGSFGGGGAGGFRQNYPSPTTAGLTITAQAYPIAVGGGGAGRASGTNANGSVSTFSTITSDGGGTGGGAATNNGPGIAGASGGGGGHGPGSPVNAQPSGAGNTPPTSPAQGTPGGTGYQSGGNYGGGGGGGATVAGTNAVGGSPTSNTGGNGGTGNYWPDATFGPTAPSYGTPGPAGSTRYFAGGGGGAYYYNTCAGQAGAGGGGRSGIEGGGSDGATAGTTNTGGGGGGGNGTGKAGGSGIVIIRYKFQ